MINGAAEEKCAPGSCWIGNKSHLRHQSKEIISLIYRSAMLWECKCVTLIPPFASTVSPRSPLLNDLNAFHLCIIGSTPFLRYTSSFCFCTGLFCIVAEVFLFLLCKICFAFFLYFSLLSNSDLLWIPWRFQKAPKTANICVFCSPKTECSHSPIDLL